MEEFKNHTFVICAYKESKYLEECIESLEKQIVKSNIIMCTSTPNDYIKNMAQKHNIPLYINEGKSGIGQDWNFVVSKTTTDYVTVAHQDDIYNENSTLQTDYNLVICEKYTIQPSKQVDLKYEKTFYLFELKTEYKK